MALDDFDWFEEQFFAELDSIFTADIACCDACYDEFLAIWPHSYVSNDGEFQKAGVLLELFYSGSRLSDSYSLGEFSQFVELIKCPRCSNPLGPNIWPYNFPFEIPDDFERNISEIADIAANTPFLLLTHPLAESTFKLLQRMGNNVLPEAIEQSLFRGRKSLPRSNITIQDYDFPPAEVAREGRYNHAGHPVLYLASDLDTCFAEMKSSRCTLAEIEYRGKLKVLDFVNPFTSHPESADELSTLIYSSMMSAKQEDEDWKKSAYVFSRFIADCATKAGFQAIKYPSTRITKTNFNLVILDQQQSLKNNGTLKEVTIMPLKI